MESSDLPLSTIFSLLYCGAKLLKSRRRKITVCFTVNTVIFRRRNLRS